MIKPNKLNPDDQVAIVSLSSGVLGMDFCKHELEIGINRLKEFGLEPVIMPNALKGIDYIKDHPEARASDLKKAFMDENIKGIICAIGGDDTYKTIPYLMDDKEFIEAVKKNSKIFTGFSDATINHFMLNRIGLATFYGPTFINDLAELDNEMLPYTKDQFMKFFTTDSNYEIESSSIWYEEREDFSSDEIGKPRKAHKETKGYETINGQGIVTGKLYGGCLESIYDAYTGSRFKEESRIIEKYHILPTESEWKEKILFLETSEEKPSPKKLEKMLIELKNRKILNLVKGIIIGKPQDEMYYNEYKEVYKKIFKDIDTPILYNVNFGHSYPRCILPYDTKTTVDFDNKKIYINSMILESGAKNKIKK